MPELIFSEWPGFDRLVLHIENGIVKASCHPYRGMKNLKTDGTFEGSAGAAYTYIMREHYTGTDAETEFLYYSDYDEENNVGLYYKNGNPEKINGEPISQEEFYKLLDEFYAKEDAPWYEFNADTIVNDFTIAWNIAVNKK